MTETQTQLAVEVPDLISQLVCEFLDDVRAGRNPQLQNFCERAGRRSDELRPLLTTIMSLESARERVSSLPVETSLPADSMPQLLGDFRLIREAGRGGMGVVYEAIEIPLNRRVAVKVLDQRIVPDAVALKRFEREARAAATLHHTNIVPVFAIGSDHNVHFYVMPFVDGITLAELLASMRATSEFNIANQPTPIAPSTDSVTRPSMPIRIDEQDQSLASGVDTVQSNSARSSTPILDPRDAAYFRRIATIGMQIADALNHASHHGILHRDIKPANLMLTVDEAIWVMDFGLARFSEPDDLTATGEVLGTPRYLAPERFSGRHTIQGDVYGLGMVLYELLTLKTAFDVADRVELVHQICTVDPIAPRNINSRIPRDLETIVQKCLEKDVSRRYLHPVDLVQDLRLFLDDRPIASRRASSWELARRWCRRSPGMASLLASVAVLLMVIAFGALLWAKSLESERDVAREAGRKATESEVAKSVALSQLTKKDDEHRQSLFQAYLGDMQSSFRSTQAGQRLKGLASAERLLEVLPFDKQTPDQQRELRNAMIANLSRADVKEIARISLATIGGHSADIHPDFEVIAVPGENAETILRWLDGFHPDVRLTSGDERFFVSNRWFSPCGKWLYELLLSPAGDTHHVRRVWDWTAKRVVLQPENINGAGSFCFHPNGRDALYLEGPAIRRYNLETGQLIASSALRFKNCGLAMSYDGKYLAVLPSHQPASVLDADTFELIATLDGVQHSGHAEWLRNVPQLFVCAKPDLLELWRPLENRHSPSLQRHTWDVTSICSSPDGRLICSTDGGSISHVIDKERGSELIQIPGEALRFSNDNKQIAIRHDNHIIVCELSPSDSCIEIIQDIETLRYSPDGSWLTTGGSQGILVYSTSSLEYKGSLGLDACGPVAWHPSGDEIATFGIFSHLARWPVREDASTHGLILDPPSSVILNPGLARLGADDNIPQHWGRHSLWSPDGKILYFADLRHNRVRTFDRSSGKTDVFAECPGASQLAISGDGRWLAAMSQMTEEIRVWDTTSQEHVLHLTEAGTAAFTENGKWLATGSRSKLRLFRTLDWEEQNELPTNDVAQNASYPLTFQPGTSLLAAAISTRMVRLFDVETRSVIADLTYQTDADFRSLTFSPDGSRLAAARAGSISLWDLARLRTELSTHGVPTPEFPETSSVPKYRPLHSINRGDDLLPWNMWWTGHQLLAKFEAIQGNLPDAIEAMNFAMQFVHRDDVESKWKVLTQRAKYHLAAQDLVAAHADLEEATRIRSTDVEVSRQLAELKLFGPSPIRDSSAAEVLFLRVCQSERATFRDQLHQVLATIFQRPKVARHAVEQLKVELTDEINDIDRLIFAILVNATSENPENERTFATLQQLSDILPDLTAEDRTRIEIAQHVVLALAARKEP